MRIMLVSLPPFAMETLAHCSTVQQCCTSTWQYLVLIVWFDLSKDFIGAPKQYPRHSIICLEVWQMNLATFLLLSSSLATFPLSSKTGQKHTNIYRECKTVRLF